MKKFLIWILSLGLAGSATARAPRAGSVPEAKNMALVGFNGLQNRSAYQPVIHRRKLQGGDPKQQRGGR